MEPLMYWTPEETRSLIAVWSEENIQLSLEESFRNEKVYREVSGRLAAVGISRTAQQCRDKIKKLKYEYRKEKQHRETGRVTRRAFKWFDEMDTTMRQWTDDTQQLATMTPEFTLSDLETESPTETHTPITSNSSFIPCPPPAPTPCPTEDPNDPGFFSIQLEDVDGPSTSTAVTIAAVQTPVKDSSRSLWSKKEVQALLTLWANPTVQNALRPYLRNSEVYANLSAKLASLGFNKEPKRCRTKIKKLKQEYKAFKNSQQLGKRSCKKVWFAFMDNVLSAKAKAARHSVTTESSVLSQPWPDLDDETQWLPDEVQVLMTLWAQPNIQKELLTTATTDQVFTYLSGELALVGFNKTPHQCSVKVNNLKEEYRRIKEVEPNRDERHDWFAILDSVHVPGGETCSGVDSSAVLTQPKSPEDNHLNDTSQAVWTSDEIKVLLSRWAEESIQKQLGSAQRDERAFAQLSSELATHGFDKTTSQCRSKIELLTQEYRQMKEQKDSKKHSGRWFATLDKVFGCCKPDSEIQQKAGVVDSAPASLQTSRQETVEDSGRCLSVSSLCLLVPTLRLMCAFAWRVVQSCNVLHYGKVEELVRLVTELAPDLLTPREKVQLLLKLRARMVLELCRSERTAKLLYIRSHLKVIENLSIGSTCDQEELEELENSKSNFVEVVRILLKDTEERKVFFKEVFPLHYGQQYEATLHTLAWKFISKLDNLLPTPDIKQTAEWLGSAPSIMEECGRLVLEADQLKALLHFHQQQSGSTNKRSPQTESMFLPRLSLPHKPDARQLASEQRTLSTGDADEGQFDYNKDAEENQTDDTAVLQDCSKGDEEQINDLTAANRSNSNNHILRQQTCSFCPYSDSQVSGLLQHIRKTHQMDEHGRSPSKEPQTANVLQKIDTETCTPEKQSAANTCEYCGKVFTCLSTLNSHRKTHTPPFNCDQCEKYYSSRKALNRHRRTHAGDRLYLCSHCGRGFRNPTCLTYHVRTHTNDRRYKCPICGKTSIQHLVRHIRMHKGEKNYLCSECGKTFLSSGELRLHFRSHTGERPYTCKHCGKGFTAKCNLTVHMRQHTGETPYKCSLCPKSFRTSRAQKKHTMIHSNKKSYQCLTCGKIFRQKDIFEMHIKTHN